MRIIDKCLAEIGEQLSGKPQTLNILFNAVVIVRLITKYLNVNNSKNKNGMKVSFIR